MTTTLFVLDEVQTGVGLTGSPWAYQQLGLEPDIVAFAKKAQVGGVMAGRRVDDVADNVFAVGGRLNSTWGGGLADMVRSRRILEIIEREGLIERAGELGTRLRAALSEVQRSHPSLVGGVRGRGLMCAFDAPSPEVRDDIVRTLREEEHVLCLPCGPRSIRFRPALSVTPDDLDSATAALGRVCARMDVVSRS